MVHSIVYIFVEISRSKKIYRSNEKDMHIVNNSSIWKAADWSKKGGPCNSVVTRRGVEDYELAGMLVWMCAMKYLLSVADLLLSNE